MPGADVELLVDREGALTPAAARFYVGCCALALEALHAHGVLHRDVKPDNLCIGGDGYARLVDLAYARSLPADGDGRCHTLLGTPEYLAPEAFTGKGQQHPSDVWAFGATLYVMLLASHPWDSGETPQHFYANVLEKPPFFPMYIIAKASRRLIEACLQCDPAARPTARGVWEHDFFTRPLPPSDPRGGLDREALLSRRLPPPFVPRLSSPLDTRHFRTAESSDDEADDGTPDEDVVTLAVTQPGGQTSVAVSQPGRRRGVSGGRVGFEDLALAAGAEDVANYHPGQPEEEPSHDP